MSKYVLNICIPTYNRSKTLIPFIENYLSCKDSRFCITVQDNCSTDGSYEALSQITDSRFVLRQNESNIGGMPNAKYALANNPNAEFLLFIIDKDYVNVNRISDFIDFLEAEHPAFGYIDLYKQRPEGIEKYPKGREAVLKLGYLGKHPSGFFWQQDLFDIEIRQPYFSTLPFKFDFWFDVVCAHFAVKHPGFIVYMPIVLHGSCNPYWIPNKTICYTADNCYFSLNKRLETMSIFLKDLFTLNLPLTDKKKIAFRLCKRTLDGVTIGLREIYHSNKECYHYNLNWHTVPWTEMLCNAVKTISTYLKLMRNNENLTSRMAYSFLLLTYTVCKFTIRSFKELVKPPKNIPFKE